jgi:RNA polymerase sigma-70 factor (ECF subfamily)
VSAVAPASLGHAPQPPSDATRLLYERHSGRIFGYCLSLLGSREDAEDAVQTTFVNAQRGLHRGVVPRFELAWLFTIARNVCHNSRQSASRRGRVETARDLDAFQDVLATPERGGSVSIGELTRALSAIPERQRRALLLREWQGLSYDEIARELNVSVAAVETLLFRARRAVAQQLQPGTGRRGDAVAALAGLVRWLFKGGAAPLKIAAATATVATATTLAVAPAVRDHAPAPPPVVPSGENSRPPLRTSDAPRVVRDRPQHSPASSVAAQTDATAAAPAAASPTIGTDSSKPSGIPPSTERSPGGNVTSETVNVPELTVGPVTTPTVTVPTVTVPTVTVPNVTVPELSIPSVESPAVQLPLDTPTLPDVPSLLEPPQLPELP